MQSQQLGIISSFTYRWSVTMPFSFRLDQILSPRSIGQRFALTIGAGAGAILIVLAVANYISGRELLLEQTSSEARKEVHDEMGKWDDLVDRIAMYPIMIGATETASSSTLKNPFVSAHWLASLLDQSPIPSVYGLYMARESMDWRDPASDIWVDRKSWPHAARLKYDFHDPAQDWYRGARETNGTHVTLPYFDEGGSEIEMISITSAVHDNQGRFIGVAGADVALTEMRKIVREMHIRNFLKNRTGSRGVDLQPTADLTPESMKEAAYLISKTGVVIIGPAATAVKRVPCLGEKDFNKLLGDLPSHGLDIGPADLQTLLTQERGWLRITGNREKVIYWATSRITGWKLILEVPFELIISPAHVLAEQSAIIGLSGLLLLLGVVSFVARRVSEPIKALQTVASNLAQGSLGEGSDVLKKIERRPDELGQLARSFSFMAKEILQREKRLSEWNANLEKTIEERTSELASAMDKVEKTNHAMRAEIAEAAAYSRAVLPRKMKGVVETDWVFETSSQLGGDSFGYHWIDENHLALYLLDVCGHGVGAALLSVSLVNVLRTASLPETDFHDPSAVLARLNTSFPMENHNDMYFTAWYGVYSLTTHQLRYACGGHPPAVLIGGGGAVSLLPAKGPVLGAFPKAQFENAMFQMNPPSSFTSPSRLYLFSDGAYEIDRQGRKMMSYEEFVQILLNTGGENRVPSILERLRKENGGEIFVDDLSLVEFRFYDMERSGISESSDKPLPFSPPAHHSSSRSITIVNSLSELQGIFSFTAEFASLEGMSREDLLDLDVIIEEVVTNILKYGKLAPDAEACSIELTRKENLLEIRISDHGIPFNPLLMPEVDTTQGIEGRPIGGLGIHFVKNLTTSQHYEYSGGRNSLTMTKELTIPSDFEV